MEGVFEAIAANTPVRSTVNVAVASTGTSSTFGVLVFFFFLDVAMDVDGSDVEEEEEGGEGTTRSVGMVTFRIALRILPQSLTDKLSVSKSKNIGEVLMR